MAFSVGFQANYQIGYGGCYPQPPQCPGPWGRPAPWNWNQGHGNLPNAQVGHHGFLGLGNTQGFALDTNNDGRYTRGRDGVLAMDLNRDGRVTPDEIQGSRQRLNALGGNFDLNGDGRTTICERAKGASYQREMRRYDCDGDGRLNGAEFARAGGRVLVDRNRDGHFQMGEQHSPFNFPTGGFGRGSLNYVDPFRGHSSVNHQGNPWGPCPWGPYR
jgi:hypothetical protein